MNGNKFFTRLPQYVVTTVSGSAASFAPLVVEHAG